MSTDYQIPEPFLFNPLKHHLAFIREFIIDVTENESAVRRDNIIKDLNHLGRSIMDVYTGSLSATDICNEIEEFLDRKKILNVEQYSLWTGTHFKDFKIISLSDGTQWTLKYHNNSQRYVHLFPSRNSRHTFRVKANTLKSAMIYNIMIGKDFITRDALNEGRALLGLSPVKDPADTEAITEMIEILR